MPQSGNSTLPSLVGCSLFYLKAGALAMLVFSVCNLLSGKPDRELVGPLVIVALIILMIPGRK